MPTPHHGYPLAFTAAQPQLTPEEHDSAIYLANRQRYTDERILIAHATTPPHSLHPFGTISVTTTLYSESRILTANYLHWRSLAIRTNLTCADGVVADWRGPQILAPNKIASFTETAVPLDAHSDCWITAATLRCLSEELGITEPEHGKTHVSVRGIYATESHLIAVTDTHTDLTFTQIVQSWEAGRHHVDEGTPILVPDSAHARLEADLPAGLAANTRNPESEITVTQRIWII